METEEPLQLGDLLERELLKDVRERAIEKIIQRAKMENVVLIGENHTNPEHTQTESELIFRIISANPAKKYALCLEPETPINEFLDVERNDLWKDGPGGIPFSMDMAYFLDTNMSSAEVIGAKLRENKFVIAVCGNAHLRHDYGIPVLLRNARTSSFTILQEDNLPTGKVSDGVYNLSSVYKIG